MNHKGKINAFSEGQGKGTRFMVSLPVDNNFSEENQKYASEVN